MDPIESSPKDALVAGTSGHASAFHWEVPGRAVSVYIDFEVVDRLNFDIMRGFGAVPRRGAEVGGILLGSAEDSGRQVVRIEDYVPIPCEHMRGPSYILSESDLKFFDEMLERWAPAPDKRIYAIGYYRSNTRDLVQLGPEDIELLDSRFPVQSAICLMVKPYATRVSEATIFARDIEGYSTEPAEQLFPFRRKEMGGGKAPRRMRGAETQEPEPERLQSGFAPEALSPAAAEFTPNVAPAVPAAVPPVESPAPSVSRFRSGWAWVPLSFLFLLLGVVLGFQVALSYREPSRPVQSASPYQLDLSVVQFGDSLHLKWNTDSEVIRQGQRGLLHIQDGDNTKSVELKQEDLGRGGVLYRNATQNVKFRLEIYVKERSSVVETLELRVLDDSSIPADKGSSKTSGRE